MAGETDPAIQRRRLRLALRKAREAAGLTQKQVAEEMDWSLSKLIRIETGAVAIGHSDLRSLLTTYGVTDPVGVAELLEMGRVARRPSPMEDLKDIVPSAAEFQRLLEYERAASIIRSFEPLGIPGILQTEDYARANIIGSIETQIDRLLADQHDEELLARAERLVELRRRRQEILTRSDPPIAHFILDEAAICRVVGNAEVMSRQLADLRRQAELPHITVRIVPFSVGIYPLRRVQYVILEFPDDMDGDVLFIENPQGDLLLREDVSRESDLTKEYLEAFYALEQLAPKEATAALLTDAINRLEG